MDSDKLRFKVDNRQVGSDIRDVATNLEGQMSKGTTLVQKQTTRILEQDLGKLLGSLNIDVEALAECVVSPGYALELGRALIPGIHYCLKGRGKMVIGSTHTLELGPHTLIVVPPISEFRLENGNGSPLQVIDGHTQRSPEIEKDKTPRFSAGDDPDSLLVICGFFSAVFGSSIELFKAASAPIHELFDASEGLDAKLKEALAELIAQEIGYGTMSSSLVKIVIVKLLRRELTSTREWMERFALFKDTNILRAFAEMAGRCGEDHTIESLAQEACLSRSAFIKRFTQALGRSPMSVLRDLRMRQAASQLQTASFTIDQVARNAGYKSRSSFIRAFKKTWGRGPEEEVDDPDA